MRAGPALQPTEICLDDQHMSLSAPETPTSASKSASRRVLLIDLGVILPWSLGIDGSYQEAGHSPDATIGSWLSIINLYCLGNQSNFETVEVPVSVMLGITAPCSLVII